METVVVLSKEDYYRVPQLEMIEAMGWFWRGEEPLLHPGCYVLHLTEKGEEILSKDD